MERKRTNIFKVEDEVADDLETQSNCSQHSRQQDRTSRERNNYPNNFRRFPNSDRRPPGKPKLSREEYEEKLKNALDLHTPQEWYPNARKLKRKFVYHCGPTNSGKTYSATEAFMKATRGIYCCPLRLQAAEIQDRCSSNNIPCDLLTGEEHWFVQENGKPADHLACTVYMASHETEYDVAVIDEIQNIGDRENGYAWTRAILGICAKEIHVCGEETCIELINNLIEPLGDTMEIEEHERDNQLIIQRRPLRELKYAEDGDCIVCFRKKHVRKVVRELNRRGKTSAKIYGTMPPAVKKDQAKIFNDPNHPAKILVATDAIGQGLNLAIKRIIFYELQKITPDESGRKTMQYLNATHAKHIAGRAGRKNLNCGEGKVTALKEEDLEKVTELLSEDSEDLLIAGLQPPIEKIVDFAIAYRNLNPQFDSYNMDAVLNTFLEMAELDRGLYFLCKLNNVRNGSEHLKDIRLSIEDKFKFCTAPVPSSSEFLYDILRKMADKYYHKEKIDASWLKRMLDWDTLPWQPRSVTDLEQLETASHAVILYMWLGNKFDEYFPDFTEMDNMQEQLLKVIKTAIQDMADLHDEENEGNRRNMDDSRHPNQRPNQQNRSRPPHYQDQPYDNRNSNYRNPHANAYGNRNARIGPRRNFQN